MRKFLLASSLVLAPLLLSQCKGLISKALDPQPTTPVLPEATQDGRNTVGFLVNDTLWLPQGTWTMPALGGYYSRGILVVSGYYDGPKKDDESGFGLYIGDARSGPGTYNLYAPLNTGKPNRATFHRKNGHYETDAQHSGTLTITRLDSVKRIVSGEFFITPVDRQGRTVRITSGRFDMQY